MIAAWGLRMTSLHCLGSATLQATCVDGPTTPVSYICRDFYAPAEDMVFLRRWPYAYVNFVALEAS